MRAASTAAWSCDQHIGPRGHAYPAWRRDKPVSRPQGAAIDLLRICGTLRFDEASAAAPPHGSVVTVVVVIIIVPALPRVVRAGLWEEIGAAETAGQWTGCVERMMLRGQLLAPAADPWREETRAVAPDQAGEPAHGTKKNSTLHTMM